MFIYTNIEYLKDICLIYLHFDKKAGVINHSGFYYLITLQIISVVVAFVVVTVAFVPGSIVAEELVFQLKLIPLRKSMLRMV